MIRLMDLSDLDKIIKIENELFTDAWDVKNFEYELKENEFSKAFVIEKDSILIGYGILYILFERAEIAILAIDNKYQGQGYGQTLIKYMIKEAILSECETISLEVRVSNNKAINLYKKNGFENVRLIKSYYSDDYEDAYEMLKIIGGLDEKNICD